MATRKVYEFNVEMACDGCSGAVKRVLGRLSEVSSIDIDMEKQKVYVTTTLPSENILAKIIKTGKACSFVGERS
ncbi:Metal homeostasis factor ATX1 [Trichoplax sp. H2]|nr:Metal homeostasis factor ATX1 [Trichoplax sp. H2]|eukprot:RDD41399.1 Metal homeostasis factor ATX1 [Trichoplax sp. H2]